MFAWIKKILNTEKKGNSSLKSLLTAFGGQKSDKELYEGIIYACTTRIARAISKVEWRLYRGAGNKVTEVLDNPLLSLLYKFNKSETKIDAMQLTGVYFVLNGEAPWRFKKAGKSPDEIEILDPNKIEICEKEESTGRATKYELTLEGGKKEKIPAEEVLMLIERHPYDKNRGIGVLEAVRLTAECDKSAREWNRGLMENHAQPSVKIEIPDDLTPETVRTIQQEYRELLAGPKNAHKLLILKNGAKMEPFSLNPLDLDFINGRKMNKEELCGIFGVPPILLGQSSDYNKATAQTAEMVFAKYTVDPILRKITEQLNEFLVPLFGQGLWLDYEPIVPEDTEQEQIAMLNGWGKWLTPNEIRQKLGRPELNGGDVIYAPMMQVPTVGVGGEKEPVKSLNFEMKALEKSEIDTFKANRILRRIYARDNRSTRANKDAGDEVANKVEQKLLNKKITLAGDVKKKCSCGHDHKDAKKKVVLSPELKLKWWQAGMEYKRKLDGSWKQKINKIFADQEKIILEKLNKSDLFKAAKNKKKIDALLFDEEAQGKATIEIIKPEYYNSLLAGAEQAADLIDESPIDILGIPQVKDWLNYVTAKYATEITSTTYTDIYTLFSMAIDDGQSINEIKTGLENYFDNITSYRAEMIARTESARAMTASQGFTWEAYGFKDVEWYAEPTACENCLELSMDEWDVKDAQKGTVEYSHPNCECRFIPK
jgi:HK97 family phage portal protein